MCSTPVLSLQNYARNLTEFSCAEEAFYFEHLSDEILAHFSKLMEAYQAEEDREEE